MTPDKNAQSDQLDRLMLDMRNFTDGIFLTVDNPGAKAECERYLTWFEQTIAEAIGNEG